MDEETESAHIHGVIRAALFLGFALLSILPSLGIAALVLSRRGERVTLDACIAYGRARPLLLGMNFAIFAGLWYAFSRAFTWLANS